jgi:hypothetical protein
MAYTEEPINAGWPVNALAPSSMDTLNTNFPVVRYDDTTEEGRGLTLVIPPAVSTVTFRWTLRAQTAPPATRTFAFKLYWQAITNNAAPPAASSRTLTDISMANLNTNWQIFSQTYALSSFSPAWAADTNYKVEITTVAPGAGTKLVGDRTVWLLEVFYS